MKRIFLFTILWWSYSTQILAQMDLLQFFQQARRNDPTYQQIVEKTLASEQNIRINRSAFLPQISLSSTPQINKLNSSGSIVTSGLYPPVNTIKSFDSQLTLNQTLINFANISDLANAKLSARQAQANLNAAFQDLILRVAKAYLKVLFDEENLADCRSSQRAFKEQLIQARQLYKSGSINITDVYTAESAYSSAQARYISAQAKLDTDKDFLGTIAGEEIKNVMPLRDNFPISLPKPENKEAWVQRSKEQNWSVKANALAVQVSRESIKQNQAAHLPTLELQVSYNVDPSTSAQGSSLIAAGASEVRNATIGLNFNMPIYSGGLVVAKTSQAQHNYKLAQRQFEASLRETIHKSRKSYLNIIASIQKIRADKITIQSAESSLKGNQDRYHLGSGTIVDLLNQQEKVLQAKTQYAINRHEYIVNLLSLKNAAGTLNVDDLAIINSWLK